MVCRTYGLHVGRISWPGPYGRGDFSELWTWGSVESSSRSCAARLGAWEHAPPLRLSVSALRVQSIDLRANMPARHPTARVREVAAILYHAPSWGRGIFGFFSLSFPRILGVPKRKTLVFWGVSLPDPPILAFFVFLVFSFCDFPCFFLCVFALFSKDFRGSARKGILFFFFWRILVKKKNIYIYI